MGLDDVWKNDKYTNSLKTKHQYKYLDSIENEERTPEDFIASTEVRAAMDRLPEDLRKTLILYYFQEEPVKDIARILSITEDAVYKRLSRARESLKEIMLNG